LIEKGIQSVEKKRTRSGRAKPVAGEKPRQTALGPPVEAFAALDEWAGEVAACVSKAELGVLLGIYRRIASDGRVSTDNRRLARKQARALRKFTEQ
jgi:hypothetical protein